MTKRTTKPPPRAPRVVIRLTPKQNEAILTLQRAQRAAGVPKLHKSQIIQRCIDMGATWIEEETDMYLSRAINQIKNPS